MALLDMPSIFSRDEATTLQVAHQCNESHDRVLTATIGLINHSEFLRGEYKYNPFTCTYSVMGNGIVKLFEELEA